MKENKKCTIADDCFHRFRNASLLLHDKMCKYGNELTDELVKLGFNKQDVEHDLDNAFAGMILLHDKYHANMHSWNNRRKANEKKTELVFKNIELSSELNKLKEDVLPIELPHSNEKELKAIAKKWKEEAGEDAYIWDRFFQKFNERK